MGGKKKKKISRQQILIYVISGLMILSLAIGFVATGSTRRARPTVAPAGNEIQVQTPVPDNAAGGNSTNDSSTGN
ncbi:MAG: hypothetical protein D6784_06345 [Chloroflexi bacterium]|nr:MAG: hypothetical protein D6784_06345 [Chloroflexota bacterium]